MNLQLYHITEPLRPYVKVICSMENNETGNSLPHFRVLPDTCVELFVNYIEPEQTITGVITSTKQPQSFIVSRMNRFMDVQNHGRSGCIAVCFHPGGASQFFSLPMNEVSNNVTDLNYLWKKAAAEMEERVMEATGNPERVAIIQEYLIKQMAKKNGEDKTVSYCLWQVNLFKGQLGIQELSGKANLSQRQLARRFNEHVGLSPKEYTRINRFIHSLTHLKKHPSMSLTEIAYESGYYDQAHFIHDYKEFAGLTPGEILTSKNILY